MNPTQRAALEARLARGGLNGNALETALRGAVPVEARSERFPAATLVVEVVVGSRYVLVHFEGDALVGASNP